WMSDESGEYELHISQASGGAPVEKIAIGSSPTFFDSLRWSPDGNRIALRDKNLNLWIANLQERRAVPVASGANADYSWAPDSQSIAYTKMLANRLWTLFLYRFTDGGTTQLTDGMADATDPVFAAEGDQIFFLASTLGGLKRGGGLSASSVPLHKRLYARRLGGSPTIQPVASANREYERILPGGLKAILLTERSGLPVFEFDLTSQKVSRVADGASQLDSAGGSV